MNLLDKVKQGMLESTKVIKEISSDMSEMSKMKVNLSKEKGRLEEIYYNLGKAIVHPETYNENPELLPEAALLILLDAQATIKNIREYEAKIEQLKGIVKCVQCATIVEPEANFCFNCGYKLTPISEIEETSDEPQTTEDMVEILDVHHENEEPEPIEKSEE